LNRAQLLRLLRGGAAVVVPPPVAPTITSGAAYTVAEETDWAQLLTASEAGTFTKVAGEDAALFTLTGALLSLAGQDYEDPDDVGTNNTYRVSVLFTATATGLTDTVTIEVTVTDVLEIPPTGGASYDFPPFLRDRELYRTILVDAGDEFIDLQAEVATPFSPAATSWTIGGADVAKIQNLGSGILVFAAATRAALAGTTLSLTVEASNAFGDSDVAALSIIVPPSANCRFASYDTGNDANNGLTPATAWKQAPKSYGGTNSTVLGSGKALFFRGHGERHRYALHKGASSSYLSLDHAGSSGSPFVYCGSGWGGRAVLDGADIITGWTPCTSQADALGNPLWASIEKIDLTAQGGAADFSTMLYCDDVMCWPAQSPTPAEPNKFEEALDVTEAGGMWRVPYTGATAGAAPRIYKAGGVIGVSDARISALFGANSPVGWRFTLWNGNNNTTPLTVASYNQATGTVTTGATSDIPNSVAGTGAYTISHHPKQISGPGQFALSADKLTLYAWRPNAGPTAISRRDRCFAFGQRSYVVAEGFQIQHYTGAQSGLALFHGFTATMTGVILRDFKVRDMRCDGGDGVGVSTSSSGACIDCNFERIHILGFNPKASGFRLANKFHGAIGGDAATVQAHVGGKIRWNYVEGDAIGRTVLYAGGIDGAHIYENVFGTQDTMHGNGISLNDGSTSAATSANSYARNCVVELNLVDGIDRGYTVSISYDGDKLVDRSNTFRRNIWLGIRSPAFHPYSGEPGGLVEENLFMGQAGDAWTGGAAWLDIGNRVVFRNNVVAGLNTTDSDVFTSPGDPLDGTIIDAAWTIQDNLDTTNIAWPTTANGGTRVLSGNTRATGAPFYTWNGVFTAEMEATLGPGQIGPFWRI
jgi:hypothetical protein